MLSYASLLLLCLLEFAVHLRSTFDAKFSFIFFLINSDSKL